MAPYVGRVMLGAMLSALASTAVVAQDGAAPIAADLSIVWELQVPAPLAGGDTARYMSPAHVLALRGITFPDSAELRALVARHGQEIWSTAGKDQVRIANKGAKASVEEKVANWQHFRELYDKLLPELRPLVPAAQRASFDKNLKALQASDYNVVFKDVNNPAFRADESPVLVRCGFKMNACWPEGLPKE